VKSYIMNSNLRFLFPFVFGLIIIAGIRLVTDMPIGEYFWEKGFFQNFVEFLFAICGCYVFDWICRSLISKNQKKNKDIKHTLIEYVIITIILFLSLNLLLLILHALLKISINIKDHVIANIVVIPTLLFYYIMTKNNQIRKIYAKQNLLFEKMKNDNLETELELLKAQYHPHFLFNALNTIYFQMDENTKSAKKSIELLSDLLRYQVYGVKHMVSLEQELNYLKSYIEFQQLRSSELLILNYQLENPSSDYKIHPLLLQPLVENAFKYVDGDYRINIRFSIENSKMVFSIENGISDETPDEKDIPGVGLANLKRRLDLLYSNQHNLTFIKSKKSYSAELTIDLKIE